MQHVCLIYVLKFMRSHEDPQVLILVWFHFRLEVDDDTNGNFVQIRTEQEAY